MQSSDIPVKFVAPFAHAAGGAYITTPVPVSSPGGSYTGLDVGFPPASAAAGGAPSIKDMNGVLNQTTAWARWIAAAGVVPYDATFQTVIGGYPKGAVLLQATGTNFWISTAENNMTNPDAAGAGWTLPIPANNSVPNAALAPMAAGTVKANTTGSAANPTDVTLSTFLTFLGFAQTIGANGSITLPGGLIINWGYATGPFSEGTNQPALTTNFPTNCLFAIGVAANPTANINQGTWIDTVSLNAGGSVFLVNREGSSSPNISGFYFLQLGN